MRVYVVSPSRSISKSFPESDRAGAFPAFFTDVVAAEAVRDRWNERYGIGGFRCEVYEVEARITRKVSQPATRGIGAFP